MKSELNEDSISVVKYFGRDVIISSANLLVRQSIQELRKIISDFSVAEITNKDEKWLGLKEDLIRLTNNLLQPDVILKRYRVELLNDALIPYLKKMKGRINIDNDRFQQLRMLIFLCDNQNASLHSHTHPAETLLEFDKIIKQINTKRGWWKSELAVALEHATQKQWLPVLSDNRNALYRFGSKLFIVGIIEVIGRPFLLLGPLYLIILDIMKIIKNIDEKKKITPQMIIKILKSLLLLFCIFKLLAILSMLNGIGYLCLISGVTALTLTMSDDMVKIASPILSPNLVLLETFFDKIYKIDENLSELLSTQTTSLNLTSTSTSTLLSNIQGTNNSNSIPNHPQVEILSDEKSTADHSIKRRTDAYKMNCDTNTNNTNTNANTQRSDDKYHDFVDDHDDNRNSENFASDSKQRTNILRQRKK
eukprot:gene13302-28176_t